MSARKKRASKGEGKEVAEPEEGAVNEILSSQLFATG
ncbi:unnamed protein product [Brassica oleracea]